MRLLCCPHRIIISSRSLLSSSFSSLTLKEQHKEFLSLVKDHGVDSRIELKRHNEKKIVELVLDNRMKRNAITGRMMMDLADHVDIITGSDFDEEIVALLLRGSGNEAFCAGICSCIFVCIIKFNSCMKSMFILHIILYVCITYHL